MTPAEANSTIRGAFTAGPSAPWPALPQRIDDAPLLTAARDMQVVHVHRRQDPNGGDVAECIQDRRVVRTLVAGPMALAGGPHHVVTGHMVHGAPARTVAFDRALGKVGMKGARH